MVWREMGSCDERTSPPNRDVYQLPSVNEFWVVPLQQLSVIEGPQAAIIDLGDGVQAANPVTTAVLPLFFSRIQILPVLCATWPSHISAALYIPTLNGRVYTPHHLLHNGTPAAVEKHMRDLVARLPGKSR